MNTGEAYGLASYSGWECSFYELTPDCYLKPSPVILFFCPILGNTAAVLLVGDGGKMVANNKKGLG
jgi:hypothetical protein